MSASSDFPVPPQDPYAPKKLRDQEARLQAERPLVRPTREVTEYPEDDEPQIPWRRSRPAVVPPPLIGRAPLPPPEPRRSVMAQLALLAGVSIVSALGVVAFYKYASETSSPAASPQQLASTSARQVPTVTVTPPAMSDEGSNSAG